MWNTILFDLDGTLTDPKVGITTAVTIALKHFGIQEDPERLTHFIGPPLYESFPEFYGFNPEQVAVAVDKFREYYSREGWLENIPYPGMSELLRDLKAAGKQLMVATSKPEAMAERILEHFEMAAYFDHICGAPPYGQAGGDKASVIRDALGRVDLERHGGYGSAVMVGDRRYDTAGAHEAGIAAIGVLYGYGDRTEHEKAGTDHIVEDLDALRRLLL